MNTSIQRILSPKQKRYQVETMTTNFVKCREYILQGEVIGWQENDITDHEGR